MLASPATFGCLAQPGGAAPTMRSRTKGSGNTPLMTRMIVAIIVTVLAALLLYFVFLYG